jgi:hypothetical protein
MRGNRSAHAATALSLVVVLLAALLAACQPLPRPFQGDVNAATADQLLDPGPQSGVLVQLATGTAVPLAVALRGAVAEALQARDVPAGTTSANAASFMLICHASPLKTLADERAEITLHWTLKNAAGRLMDSFIQSHELPLAEWLDPAPDTIAFFAELVADRVAVKLGAIAGPEPAAPASGAAGALWPVIELRTVTGAPGDGNEALKAAVASRLTAAGVPFATTGAGAAYAIEGRVATHDVTAEIQQLDVVWYLLDPSGAEIGTVSQSGDVARTMLDDRWGPLATTIADYGASGLLDLLREAIATEPGS